MTPDKDMQSDSGFTTKQKAMAAGVVIILIILVWQIYGLIAGSGSSGSSSTTMVPVKPLQPGMKPQGQMTNTAMTPTTPSGAMPLSNPAGNMNAPMPTNTPQTTMLQQPQAAKDAQAMSNADLLKKQKDQQEKYLTTVNELQMLKLQKDIAETNQAISAAKLATATAEKNINDLLVKPLPPQLPPPNYASSLIGPTSAAPLGSGPVNLTPTEISVPYVVISVSMQMNKWTAVLGSAGKLYNVSSGDVMSDGWVVAHISREGVVLKRGGVSKKVSLVPVI